MPPLNDNEMPDKPGSPQPLRAGPCDQAAMLLVESLIHGMVEHSLITVAHAIEIVDTASEVGMEAEDDADPARPGPSTVALLTSLSRSLRTDLHAA